MLWLAAFSVFMASVTAITLGALRYAKAQDAPDAEPDSVELSDAAIRLIDRLTKESTKLRKEADAGVHRWPLVAAEDLRKAKRLEAFVARVRSGKVEVQHLDGWLAEELSP